MGARGEGEVNGIGGVKKKKKKKKSVGEGCLNGMWIENAFLAAESIRTLSVSEHVAGEVRGWRARRRRPQRIDLNTQHLRHTLFSSFTSKVRQLPCHPPRSIWKRKIHSWRKHVLILPISVGLTCVIKWKQLTVHSIKSVFFFFFLQISIHRWKLLRN